MLCFANSSLIDRVHDTMSTMVTRERKVVVSQRYTIFLSSFFFFFFRHQQVSTIRASELSSLPLFVVVNEKECFHTR